MKAIRILAVVMVLVTGILLVRGPQNGEEALGRADRVLIVSIPTLTWDMVATEQPPNLVELFGRSTVASASVRTIGASTDLGEGYGTIGAGNRASVPEEQAGLAFPPDVEYDGEPIADVYERRFGVDTDGAEVLQIGAAAIQRRNDRLLYGADIGSLGDALRDNDRRAAVVANGDLEQGPPVDRLHREAVLAVMDGVGRVPRGSVAPDLLSAGIDTPSGLGLNPQTVLEVSADLWRDSDVLLVELSDLLRAESSRHVVTPDVEERTRLEALQSTDEILGELIELTDPARDLVIVVSPVSPAGPDQLVVAALSGPGVEPGLARSGTARRDGYVTLPDIAPTVLQVLGIDKPAAMTGAPIASGGGGAPDGSVFSALAEDNERALFRNRLVGPFTVVFIVVQVLTYALAAYALSNRRMRWCRTAAFLLLAGMAVPVLSFLIGLFPYRQLGLIGALFAVLGVAGLLAFLLRRLVDRLPTDSPAAVHVRALTPPLVLTGATAVVLVADIAVGGPLQIDTPFGYTAIVAGRIAGYGNLAWGLMVTALIITVTGLWGRWQLTNPDGAAPTERRFALGLVAATFALAVLAVGMPALGANVGGTLSVVSGLLIVGLLLAGIRLDLRRLLAVGVVTVAVLALFGIIDVQRPPEKQTHLGRLIEKALGDEGIPGLGTVLERKVNANLNILTSSVWAYVIPAALGFLAFLIGRPPQFLRNLFRNVPGMRACVIGVLATGAVGGIVNDSGIAIPAIMLTLLLPHVAYVIVVSHSTGSTVIEVGAEDGP